MFDSADVMGVIVRASGERTADACRKICADVTAPDKCQLVTESPFELALQRTCDVAGMTDCEWTLVVDADVLLSPTCISRMAERLPTAGPNVFQFQWPVLDKLFGLSRYAGVRLYRTALLPRASVHIPASGTSYRPESDMTSAMSENGFRTVLLDDVVGIHDFEQSFADIYRKAGLHARKHSTLLPALLPAWRRAAATDIDFFVAAWSVVHVLEGHFVPSLNRRQVSADIVSRLSEMGIRHKQPLEVDQAAIVERTLASWAPTRESYRLDRYLKKNSAGHSVLEPFASRIRRLRIHRERSLVRRQLCCVPQY